MADIDEPKSFEEMDLRLCQYLDLFSSTSTESCYVLDVIRKEICYVKRDDLFLCGFSVEEALRRGYDFYRMIVHPDDLSLWANMRDEVLRYLKKYEERRDEVDFFSCTFRLRQSYSFLSSPLSMMVIHRMKPVWEAGELRYLICSVGSTTIRDTGNLRIYYKEGLSYEAYNLITNRWKRILKRSLSEREKAIMMLARQGKNTEEMANDLCKSVNTIRNQIKALFLKLEVHSIQEAVELVYYDRMVYLK